MNPILNLFQSKFARTAGIITFIILTLVLILSPKREVSPDVVDNELSSSPRPELSDLAREKRNEAMIYTAGIESKLPIYFENFTTSVGITTTINVYRLDSDEAEVVRLEIYGLSYINSDPDETKNPNVTAYKESYLKALELIESKNIDPKKLIFIYGDREYVRETTATWIKALNLHP